MPKQKKSRHTELHTVWVHLCDAPQAKLIYTDPKQVLGTRVGLTGKGQKEHVWVIRMLFFFILMVVTQVYGFSKLCTL